MIQLLGQVKLLHLFMLQLADDWQPFHEEVALICHAMHYMLQHALPFTKGMLCTHDISYAMS